MSGPLVEVPYFDSRCREAMAAYLNSFGFVPVTLGCNGREVDDTSFSNVEVVLRFCYWPEDFPRYHLMILIGCLKEQSNLVGPMIGLWYLLPPEEEQSWEFKSEVELDQVFVRVRDAIFPQYIVPYFTDPQLLAQKVKQFQSQQRAQSAKIELERIERQRVQAQTEFQNGNFEEVLSIYAQFSPVDFTDLDTKRLRLAQKRMRL